MNARLYKLEEIAGARIPKSVRWINEFLNKHPCDDLDRPLYHQAGRDKLLTDMPRELFTIDEAAVVIRKSRHWLTLFLSRKPTDAFGRPFYSQAGRTKLFTREGMQRILEAAAAENVKASQREIDAHALLPTIGLTNCSVVYFVRGGDFIKIGYSKRWQGRLSALQTGSPIKLELLHVEAGDASKEKALHRLFQHLHSHREWFRAARDLIDYISMLKSGGH